MGAARSMSEEEDGAELSCRLLLDPPFPPVGCPYRVHTESTPTHAVMSHSHCHGEGRRGDLSRRPRTHRPPAAPPPSRAPDRDPPCPHLTQLPHPVAPAGELLPSPDGGVWALRMHDREIEVLAAMNALPGRPGDDDVAARLLLLHQYLDEQVWEDVGVWGWEGGEVCMWRGEALLHPAGAF
eukprot:366394-Chlamydomonas_euryale.AAC.8